MKKLLATLTLAVLAFVPATSAWAGGTGGPSSRDTPAVSPSEARGATDSSGARKLFAWGCNDGQYFVVYIDDNGNLSGHNVGGSCDHNFVRMVA